MRLQYEIAATGVSSLRNQIRSAESLLRGHARQTEAITRRATGTSRPQRPGEALRGFDQIGRAARAADLRSSREQMTMERRRHAEAVRHRQREARLMAQGIASIGKAAQADELKRHRQAMVNAQRENAARARMAGRTATSAARGVAGAVRTGVGNVVGMGAGVLGIGGGFAVAGAIREQSNINAAASRLANQAGRPEIKGELAREVTGIQGFTGQEALAGLESFVDVTGDLESARRLLPQLSQLALATGTSLDELAAAAGNAFIPLADQIKDPAERLKALDRVMRTIAAQGAVGAVEIKDLASEMAGLAAATNKFQGAPDELLGVVGAMAQAARQRGGASSAAEATTSVSRFVTDLIGNQDRFKKAGINVFADKGRTKLRDPREIITDVLKQTGGDLGKVNKMFGVFAERSVAGFSPLFTQAGGGEAGAAAVREEFDRLLNVRMSEGDVGKRASSRLADSDLRFKEEVKKFNEQIGTRLLPIINSQLLPAFTKLAPHVADAADAAARFANWFADNPLKGIGAIIGVAVAKDIAIAGVGKLAGNALESVIRAMMPKAPGAPPGVPLPGAGGKSPISIPLGATPNAVTSVKGMGAIGSALSMSGAIQKMQPAVAEQAAMDIERAKQEPWYEAIFRGLGKGSGSAVDVALFGGEKGKNVEAERVAEATQRADDKQMLAAAQAQQQAAEKLDAAATRLASLNVDPKRTSPIAQR